MFLHDIPVAGIARRGTKTVQLRLANAEWPFTPNISPVTFFSLKGAVPQGTYVVEVQHTGMSVTDLNSGEHDSGTVQSNAFLTRRIDLKNSGDDEWFDTAPVWSVLHLSQPLPRDIEEDSTLVITASSGQRAHFPIGFYKSGDASVLVKADMGDYLPLYDARLDYDPVTVTGMDIEGFSLITLSLSSPLKDELYSSDTCAVYFTDLTKAGWNTSYGSWATSSSGEITSGESNAMVSMKVHHGKYGAGLTLSNQHLSSLGLSYQAPVTLDPSVTIFPYLTVRDNGLIYTRDRVDLSQGGVGLFDGLGSFRTHIMESIGNLSILRNRYKTDGAVVKYMYDSMIKMLKTIPRFFNTDDMSNVGRLQYPAPYTYSMGCLSYPARDESAEYDVVQVSSANGEIILPDSSTSRIIQITRSHPGQDNLHIRRDDAVEIKAVFLPGGQTIYGDTATPYPTTVYRGVILSEPLDEETLYLVRTVSGTNDESDSRVVNTVAEKYQLNKGMALKTIEWMNDGRGYALSRNFSPYWTFPFLDSRSPHGYEGIKPDDAALTLFLGLLLQEDDDSALKQWGGTLIDLSLPWLAETWKLVHVSSQTNTDFGLYATTQFTTVDVPSSVPSQTISLKTPHGDYYAYTQQGKTSYPLADFVLASFLQPSSRVNAYTEVVSSSTILGGTFPAVRMDFSVEGYVVFPYGKKSAPRVSLQSSGYCRLILTDTEGWRYAAQLDNQTLVDWDSSSLTPDIFQKNYAKAPPLLTNPIDTVEVHGDSSYAILAWLSDLPMEESTFKGGEVYEVGAGSSFTVGINSLVNLGESFQGAYPYFIGKNGLNPFTKSTDTPFRGPLSVLQQAPLVYSLQDDIGSASTSVSLVKQAQEYYLNHATVLTEKWDGQVDHRPAPFLTGVAPSYCYTQDDSYWAESSSPGFSWKSPIDDWADARNTFKMYFNLALYWRQCNIQGTAIPADLPEVFQRMIGGIQYLYNVVYAVGKEYLLTKSGIAVAGVWRSYRQGIDAGDARLFWCGFGEKGPCVGHNFGAVCYALATMILIYQAGMKDQKVFDYINRLINTLYSYSGSQWWSTSKTFLTEPVLTQEWTSAAMSNTPELTDFYILNGEDYGVFMFVVGLIDNYFTDADTADSTYSRFPRLYTVSALQNVQVEDGFPDAENHELYHGRSGSL